MANPQGLITSFWDQFIIKYPGRVTSIFPPHLYANLLPEKTPEGSSRSTSVSTSYEAAAAECRRRVESIVKQCDRTNEKFIDLDFDIEADFERRNWNCMRNTMFLTSDWITEDEFNEHRHPDVEALRGAFQTVLKSGIIRDNEKDLLTVDAAALFASLNGKGGKPPRKPPGAVHRVDYLYENPSFVVDGFGSSDVQQGSNGDCWFLAAVSSLCSTGGVLEKVCVARNEECGVYGFVFFRDGEWISTVVDDNLYLRYEDFDDISNVYDETGEKEAQYRERAQTGSKALYFAKCSEQNEMWLPLLEKAYAKVHGDYSAISGGCSGEAVEDLTGGITTSARLTTIRSKEKLWQELLNPDKEFIFSVSSHRLTMGASNDDTARRGLPLGHAYSILRAIEEKDEDGKEVRLVLIRNPWGARDGGGNGEWNGPWSDGSKEWNSYWLQKLNHQFGDDGVFWISYQDFLRRFKMISRTRIFHGDNWQVAQKWAAVAVPWVSTYLNTKFQFTLTKADTVVIVLSQLDTRYFRGLEGSYMFELHFLLHRVGDDPEEYIVRAKASAVGSTYRSISAETALEPGTYEVVPKILAHRDPNEPPLGVLVRKAAESNPAKLRQLGLNHDVAQAKVLDEDEEPQPPEQPRVVYQSQVEGAAGQVEAYSSYFCDVCMKEFDASAPRVTCVQCEDYDLCWFCYEKGAVSKTHETSHEVRGVDQPGFICDVCNGKFNFSATHFRCLECEGYYSCKPCYENGHVSKSHESSHKVQEGGATQVAAVNGDVPNADGVAPGNGVDPEPREEISPEVQEHYFKMVTENHAAQQAQAAASSGMEPHENPWNAVCVIGLRVYSKQVDMEISLVKHRKMAEASMLDVGGFMPTGPTTGMTGF